MFAQITVSLVMLASVIEAIVTSGPYSQTRFVGDRKTIVELFEWKYSDIAEECESFLGPNGYAAVQVSPFAENAVLSAPALRTWIERYQPVSYELKTRSGDERQLRDMIHRCNKAGVRVVVDTVLNQMASGAEGHGTAGNTYDPTNFSYPGLGFTAQDIHRENVCGAPNLTISNFANTTEVRDCELSGLVDLDQTSPRVRRAQIDFLNKLVDMGVVGFRNDLSLLQWPEDLNAILSSVHNLNPLYFGSLNARPFVYHEVSAYQYGSTIQDSEYFSMGRVLQFKYAETVGSIFVKENGAELADLSGLGGKGWDIDPSGDAIALLDSHDLQRGLRGKFEHNLSFFNIKLLKLASIFMLAHPYGTPKIMSSYYFPRNTSNPADLSIWQSPPMDSDQKTLNVLNAGHACNEGWVCEHRWREMYSMAQFRNIVGDQPLTNWWDNGSDAIAFSRGSKGFVAINNGDKPVNQTLATGLPEGQYCDVLTGERDGTQCTGRVVKVDNRGNAQVFLDNNSNVPALAIHSKSRILTIGGILTGIF